MIYDNLYLVVLFLQNPSSIIELPKLYTRRSRIEILANILNETKSGLNKAGILRKCNMNYVQLHLCLNFLLEKQLLEKKTEENGQEKFLTTKKGKIFVKKFLALQL